MKKNDTELIAKIMNVNMNIKCLAYHGGLSDKVRQEVHTKFQMDEVKVIVNF